MEQSASFQGKTSLQPLSMHMPARGWGWGGNRDIFPMEQSILLYCIAEPLHTFVALGKGEMERGQDSQKHA